MKPNASGYGISLITNPGGNVSCESLGLPACLAKSSKFIMGELQYAQNGWCYTNILICTNLHWQQDVRVRVLQLPPTLWPDSTGNCFIAESHPLAYNIYVIRYLRFFIFTHENFFLTFYQCKAIFYWYDSYIMCVAILPIKCKY